MHRFVSLISIAFIFILAALAPATEQRAYDRTTCAEASGDVAIAACTRAIASGKFKGQSLAEIYVDRGIEWDNKREYDRAIADYGEAIRINPNDARALYSLGVVYDAQGKSTEALPLYKRALAIREKALGPDHPNVAASLDSLAGVYLAPGRYAEAEPLHKRALAIYEKALGPDHADVATSLNNLAELYRNQGRYAEAEPLHKRALAIREKALGLDHPAVATSL